MNTTQETRPSFDSIINACPDDYLLEAIKESAPDCFEPFIKTKHGSYALGTFKTRNEAETAIKDALEARFNG